MLYKENRPFHGFIAFFFQLLTVEKLGKIRPHH